MKEKDRIRTAKKRKWKDECKETPNQEGWNKKGWLNKINGNIKWIGWRKKRKDECIWNKDAWIIGWNESWNPWWLAKRENE